MFAGGLGPLGLKPAPDHHRQGHAPVTPFLAQRRDVGGNASLRGRCAPRELSRFSTPQHVPQQAEEVPDDFIELPVIDHPFDDPWVETRVVCGTVGVIQAATTNVYHIPTPNATLGGHAGRFQGACGGFLLEGKHIRDAFQRAETLAGDSFYIAQTEACHMEAHAPPMSPWALLGSPKRRAG